MAHDLRAKATSLRRQGYSYSEIVENLKTNIPKSTLSEWCKNLKLTPLQTDLLRKNISKKLKKSQEKALQINKKRRREYLQNLKDKNKHLLKLMNNDVQKLLLSVLYLGEGAKTKSTEHLSLGSSNPNIISFYISLLKTCFKIDNSKFRVRIQCRADQNIGDLEKYWKNITKIPKKQFYPTYVDRRTINKPTLSKKYKGVCVIMYFDRSIQFELEFLANSVIKYLDQGR